MADHGVNRRRSHNARKRQRKGKLKHGKSVAKNKRKLKAARRFWRGKEAYPK